MKKSSHSKQPIFSVHSADPLDAICSDADFISLNAVQSAISLTRAVYLFQDDFDDSSKEKKEEYIRQGQNSLQIAGEALAGLEYAEQWCTFSFLLHSYNEFEGLLKAAKAKADR